MQRAAVNLSVRTCIRNVISNPVVRRQLITVISVGCLTCFRRFSVSSGYYKNLEEEFQRRKEATADDLYKGVNGEWTDAESTSKQVKETLKCATHETSVTSAKYYGNLKDVNPTLRGRKYEGFASSDANSSLSRWSNSNVPSASPKASSSGKIIDYAKKCYGIVKDEFVSNPSNRRRLVYDSSSLSKRLDENAKPATGELSNRTDIVSVPVKESRWSKEWEACKRKMNEYPAVKYIREISKPILTEVAEIAEDVREFWETSDHPVIDEIKYQFDPFIEPLRRESRIFTKIYSRDPDFSLPAFLAEVEEMIKPTLTAYLKGDVETLKKNCSPHIIEKSLRERKAYESQDMFFDTKIIHVTEWNSWGEQKYRTKLMGDSPLIIIRTWTQQIYCVRNRHGYIKDGAEDHIVDVEYDLAMQQLSVEEQGEGALYPTWWLRGIRQNYQIKLLV